MSQVPGFWESPLSAQEVALGSNRLAFPRSLGGRLYWMESLAEEDNRWVVRSRAIGTLQSDVTPHNHTPEGFGLGSRVHEYGGCAYGLGVGGLVWINKRDQAVYRDSALGLERLYQHDAWRFGEPLVLSNGVVLIAERHDGGTVENLLVFCDWSGELRTLHQGEDFYAAPAMSPDGETLVWQSWNMPNQPWDHSRLWRANWCPDGQIAEVECLYDTPEVAIFQPDFTPEGGLRWVDDRRGFGQIFAEGSTRALTPESSECALPLWQLGMRSYAALGYERYAVTAACAGVWELTLWEGNRPIKIDLQDAHVSDPVVVCDSAESESVGFAVLVAPSDDAAQLMYFALEDLLEDSRTVPKICRRAGSRPERAVVPESLWFAGSYGKVQGYFYAPEGASMPPVIMKSHGGPSGQSDPGLNLKMQFWVSRGFAVFDVNYSGSTGFGRAYRQRLDGLWGEADVADCLSGLEFLIAEGRINGDQAFISGSSAGGLTTLGCLCRSDKFAGGVVSYGVADLEGLVAITHKFEACYLERLVGRLPEERARYQARSPLYHAEQIRVPVLFLQGGKDSVVPPSQTEAMAAAIKPHVSDVEVLLFPGESHGFRETQTIIRALEAELEFYQRQLLKH